MGYHKRPIKSKSIRRSLFTSSVNKNTTLFYPEKKKNRESVMATAAAAVVFTVAPPVSSSSSLRTTRRERETLSSSSLSISFSPSSSLSISFSPSSSSSFSQFPSLSFSATQQRNHRGYVVVACLPSSSSPENSTSSPESNTSLSPTLYISGLSFRTTEKSLRNAFRNFGKLVEVNLVMNRITNRPKGYAFLRYGTEEESKKAIEGMHGKFLDGRVIFVEVAKPRSEMKRLKETLKQYG